MTATITRIARPESWRRAFIARQGAKCHYCDRAGSLEMGPGHRLWHVDHMKALARGGEDSEENLVLSCKRCNLAKGTQEYGMFKRFAGAAYRRGDGVSDEDINSLMRGWKESTASGMWWIGRTDEGALALVDSDSAGPDSDAALPLLIASGGTGSVETRDAISFIAQAHRLIPDLVAEVRQLRAELNNQEVAA